MAEQAPSVQVSDNTGRQRYEAWVDGVLAGYAEYELDPGGIVFTHTKVEHAFEGHGVGSHLAQSALDDARSRGLVVTPRCPFMAEFIDHHPAYRDLVGPTG